MFVVSTGPLSPVVRAPRLFPAVIANQIKNTFTKRAFPLHSMLLQVSAPRHSAAWLGFLGSHSGRVELGFRNNKMGILARYCE